MCCAPQARKRKGRLTATLLLVAGSLSLVTIWLQRGALSNTQPAASTAPSPRRAQAGGALTDVSSKNPPPRRAQAGGALIDVSGKDPSPRRAQAGSALTDLSSKDPSPRRAQAGGALTDVSGKDPPPRRAQAGGALTDVSGKDPPPRRAQAGGALIDVSKPTSLTNHAAAPASAVKVILMDSFPVYYLVPGTEVFSSCKHSCTITYDSKLVSKVDSVVAYFPLFKYNVPPQRRPLNQVWVFFAKESPIVSDSTILAKPVWRNWFNWTLSYRRDSDFYSSYGDFVKRSSSVPVGNLTSLVNGKTKMVAWFVLHCRTQSKREDFAAALKKFIPVDIYGKCGNMSCPRANKVACRRMLARDYHFYLAFENAFCKDYITEKVYTNYDVIPVVRGGANYTALLPNNSFIDASKFSSVKALAQYLMKVVADKELCRSYFAWKGKWRLEYFQRNLDFCKLCERLHNLDRWARVYPNMDSWWREDGDAGCSNEVYRPPQSRQVAMELLTKGFLLWPGFLPAGIVEWAELE